MKQRSELDGYAEKLRSRVAIPSGAHPGNPESALKTSLPRIRLSQFSGAYSDWPSFRDLFLSVIGQNSSVSAIERFYYFRSSLQGQAEKLIRSLPVTAENYDRAWAILCKHFDNKKELIRSNFSAFTAAPKMKGDTAEELSRIHNAVTATVNAQESIGRPINTHGMDLFNHLVIELFDARTRLEWESSTSNSMEPAQHNTLLDFISRRILTLNAAKSKSIMKNSGDSSPRAAKSHVAKQETDTPQCALCQEKHQLVPGVQDQIRCRSEDIC